LFCIRHERKIIGLRCVHLFRHQPDKAMGMGIYIAPEMRGRGYGKRLLAASLTRNGYTYQYTCNAGNTASLNTALSAGYRISGYVSICVKPGKETGDNI
jgi:GNAT superfamily N-acetyltransferase